MEILLATNNSGKVARYRRLFGEIDPELLAHTPAELGLAVSSVAEDTGSLVSNAIQKVKSFKGQVDMPVIGNDTGFFVEGEGLVLAPKRAALDSVGERGGGGTQDARILEFWQAIARRHGGQVNAAWVEGFAALFRDGTIRTAESTREVILTDQVLGDPPPELPVRALYYSKATCKPAITHSPAEELLEMEPIIEALRSVLDIQG